MTVENLIEQMTKDKTHIEIFGAGNMSDKMVALWNVGGPAVPFYEPVIDVRLDSVDPSLVIPAYKVPEDDRDKKSINVAQIVVGGENSLGAMISQEEFINKLKSLPDNLLVLHGGHELDDGTCDIAAPVMYVTGIDTNDADRMDEIDVVDYMKDVVGKESYIALVM